MEKTRLIDYYSKSYNFRYPKNNLKILAPDFNSQPGLGLAEKGVCAHE
jgi:hypothetical protein